MAIEFVEKTKNKLSVIWTDENDQRKYNVGNITISTQKFNDLRIHDIEQIMSKMKELQREFES